MYKEVIITQLLMLSKSFIVVDRTYSHVSINGLLLY